MIFERKETDLEKPKTHFWTLLKWYWFIAPSVLYIIILPRLVQNGSGTTFTNKDVFTMLFQFMNYIFSGLMFMTNPIERSKSGVADNFLKIAVAQQFLARNILGAILTILAWYQLPYKVEHKLVQSEDKNNFYFKPKTILILATVNLSFAILSVIANLI